MTPQEKARQKQLGLKVVRLDEEKISHRLKIFRIDELRAIVLSRNNKGKREK